MLRRVVSMSDHFELSPTDAEYPRLLLETPDPPRRLFGRGDPQALVDGLAVIGSRRATPYGVSASSLFAGWAARAGIPVVSGGAYGCDQAAHWAAVQAGGRTVAVMGCGADVSYPKSAASLFTEILTTGGAVVSEQHWGTQPQPWMFRRRNRIIAGLSHAVLVVEAGLPSGTFSTADDALAAGRSVLAVPGSILSEYSRGSNRLIRQGATPITDLSDLRDELRLLTDGQESLQSLVPHVDAGDDSRVLEAVRAHAARPDDLARHLRTDVVSVARAIGRLEARGLVGRHYDGTYHPIAGA